MIRVLASDLDGTLLDKKCRISAETAEAVEMAQRAGIRFVAATGRAWGTAYPFFQKAGIKADYVLLNGAEFRASSGTIIYQETIQRNAAEKVIESNQNNGVAKEIYQIINYDNYPQFLS